MIKGASATTRPSQYLCVRASHTLKTSPSTLPLDAFYFPTSDEHHHQH